MIDMKNNRIGLIGGIGTEDSTKYVKYLKNRLTEDKDGTYLKYWINV